VLRLRGHRLTAASESPRLCLIRCSCRHLGARFLSCMGDVPRSTARLRWRLVSRRRTWTPPRGGAITAVQRPPPARPRKLLHRWRVPVDLPVKTSRAGASHSITSNLESRARTDASAASLGDGITSTSTDSLEVLAGAGSGTISCTRTTQIRRRWSRPPSHRVPDRFRSYPLTAAHGRLGSAITGLRVGPNRVDTKLARPSMRNPHTGRTCSLLVCRSTSRERYARTCGSLPSSL
jgi:hypothetical protein